MGTGIYHNGLTAVPYPCQIRIEGNSIEIYLITENKTLYCLFENIKLCQGNKTSLLVSYGDYPHQSFECSGPEAEVIFSNWSKNSLARKTEGVFFSKNKWTIAGLCVAFLALCLFGYFVALPWAGERAAALIPETVEAEMGDKLSAVFTDEYTSLDSASYYVQQFVNELHYDSLYQIKVQVLETDQLNAFALPGGKIFIYQGILQNIETPEELAALLAHEVTHVNQRHSLKHICRSLAASYVIAALFGDVTGISAAVLTQADQFKQLDYSRELETKADLDGMALMIRKKVNPKGMSDLLRMLKTEGGRLPGMMKYLSSHPETDERIHAVITNKNYNQQFETNEQLMILFNKIKQVVNEDATN